jgi:phage tail sheath gpL-like
LAADEFLSSIPVGDRIATSANLTTKTTTLGVFDADDVVFTAVTGDQSEAVVMIQDTGDAATSPLIAYIDSATGLPITPSGSDITITWADTASKIFKI